MAKYLICTKEGDFISASRNAKKHTLQTTGKGVMIYDKDGILINSTSKDSDGSIEIYGSRFYDGEPRQWAIDFIKYNRVGKIVEDAERTYYQNFK